MQQIENKILNQLLDRYENSKLSRNENTRAIHITYSFRKNTIPQYFDESSNAADEINSVMMELQREKIINIVWKNGKIDGIIDKVVLQEDAVGVVYKRLGRISKLSAEKDAEALLNRMQNKISGNITIAFLNRMLDRIETGKSVKEYFDIIDLKQAENLIYALDCIENNQKDCYVREFSIEYFQDSKMFEQLIPKVCHVIREEREEFSEFENEEILAEYFIYKNPGYVYIKGNAFLVTSNEKMLDISILPDGIGFAISRNTMVRVVPSESIREVYTIENLTSFYRFHKENSLVIYLGGYHNKVRQLLLLQIYEILPNAKYYHFGDIDVGEFQIFYHLCEKTRIPFQTYKMDMQTMKQYEKYTKLLTVNDRKRLQKLMETKLSEEEKRLAQYMLEHNIKLEQECILE